MSVSGKFRIFGVLITTGLAAVIGVGCGKDKGQTGVSYEGVYLAPSLPRDQQTLLKKDIDHLKSVRLEKMDPHFKEILKINDSSEIFPWLQSRVKILVPTTFSAKAKLIGTQLYPNAHLVPSLHKTLATTNLHEGERDDSVLADNVGAAVYLSGKLSEKLFALDIEGLGQKVIGSPREGIIRLGKLFFRDNSYDEEATLLHEARHSDGNGMHVTFFHPECQHHPSLKNKHACDQTLNGPYMVGALYLKSVLASRTDLTTEERKVLIALMLDYLSRVEGWHHQLLLHKMYAVVAAGTNGVHIPGHFITFGHGLHPGSTPTLGEPDDAPEIIQ